MVAAYAVAMAWVEAAVVLYLRTLTGEYDPARPAPEMLSPHLILAECVREFATLVMLGAVGWLAGRNARTRLGAFVLAFGIWDIGYYVFLVPLTGWPASPADWDILFLLPLPWWGPVWSPVSIALLMVVGGTRVFLADEPDRPCWPTRRTLGLALAGAALALGVFMADSVRQLSHGDANRLDTAPESFPVALFAVAWLLMAAPLISLFRPRRKAGA
jgi:hypothetical protein